MPAVVRVKRRIDEEPLGAFVLNGKKRRIDDGDSTITNTTPLDLFDTNKDEISTILKFAGTVQSQDDKVTKQIARLTKDEAIELAKKHRQQPISATERGRQEMRAQSNENRFKVVNCFRSIDTETTDANPKEITIVDIEKQPLVSVKEQDPANIATTSSNRGHNEIQQTATNVEDFTPTDSDGYVYDLYLPENEQQADNVDYTDNYLRIHVHDKLVFEDSYNDEEDGEESEDSNEENHFGNDYPDEEDDEDDEAMDFRTMRKAIESVNFDSNDEDELSTDEDDKPVRSGFVFSVDASDEEFEDDVDFRDADRYGMAYARYKKRILRNMRKRDSEDDNDDDDKSELDQIDGYGYDENSDSE